MQQTLARAITCDGISLHQGENVAMVMKPAPENTGICFKRTDIEEEAASLIPADYKNVVDTRLCTVLENPYGVRVSTVEHLMAALWGCGIDNALIEINGPEVPVMDGSSEPFVFLIECAGIQQQDAPRRYIKIDAPIVVNDGDSCAMLQACDEGFALDVDIDFEHDAVGQQSYHFNNVEMAFKQVLSRARTFGFLKDVEALRSMGLAQGGSLHNAVVIDDDGIMNNDGLRYDDECVRHKALDCIGDYFLAGYRILGQVKTSRPGHAINNRLMKALFANPSAWHYVEETDLTVLPESMTPVMGIASTSQTITARL